MEAGRRRSRARRARDGGPRSAPRMATLLPAGATRVFRPARRLPRAPSPRGAAAWSWSSASGRRASRWTPRPASSTQRLEGRAGLLARAPLTQSAPPVGRSGATAVRATRDPSIRPTKIVTRRSRGRAPVRPATRRVQKMRSMQRSDDATARPDSVAHVVLGSCRHQRRTWQNRTPVGWEEGEAREEATDDWFHAGGADDRGDPRRILAAVAIPRSPPTRSKTSRRRATSRRSTRELTYYQGRARARVLVLRQRQRALTPGTNPGFGEVPPPRCAWKHRHQLDHHRLLLDSAHYRLRRPWHHHRHQRRQRLPPRTRVGDLDGSDINANLRPRHTISGGEIQARRMVITNELE